MDENLVSLLEIFLNSSCPEGEASLWFQRQNKLSTTSFLSKLLKPTNVVISSSPSSSAGPAIGRCMWIETLPNRIQSRILSFLAMEKRRFCTKDLHSLAIKILGSGPERKTQLDFWVEKAAHNLLDAISSYYPPKNSNACSNSILNFDLSCSEEDKRQDNEQEEFVTLPTWLESHTIRTATDSLLPWLSLSPSGLHVKTQIGNTLDGSKNKASVIETDNEEEKEAKLNQLSTGEIVPMEIESEKSAILGPEIQNRAVALKTQLLSFDSASKPMSLANEIRQLCCNLDMRDQLPVLALIEPWEAEDEMAAVLLSHLLGASEEFPWSSQVLSSVILPKLLILREPASRVLLSATIECCKLHQRAAVDALLFPLVLRKEGINTPLCDVLTRIIRECLHPAHVSAFCQKLLHKEDGERRFICMPCHLCLISEELVWTEALFVLFQNILNHNVHLTPDSVDHLVFVLGTIVDRFSKSLKFGNFFLCLVSKCYRLSDDHKISLVKVAERTNTFMTKSILSKLGA